MVAPRAPEPTAMPLEGQARALLRSHPGDGLAPLLDAVAANTKATPAEVSADSGFCSETNLADLAKRAAKYRGPSGEEWSGRGRVPNWLAALETEGRRREEFLIRG